ncbi:hypothetical protein AgCh_038080 [Apium graveolens]
MTGEPAIEAPVNGDRNYNGPKVAKFLVGLGGRRRRPPSGGPEPSVRYHSGRARILTLYQDLRAKGQSQDPPPKRRKRSRNKRLSSPGPVVPQLLPWLLPTGIPHSERLLGRPLGPKLYATAMVPIDSLLQRRYQTLQAEHLFLVYRFTPRRGMCTSSNNKNGTIGSYAGIISGYRPNHLNSPFLACYSYESLSMAGMGDYR